MKYAFITFRSVTFAQRGEQVLTRGGIRCALLRTPKWMEAQGCGYSLRLSWRDAEMAVDMLRESQVKFRKVYVQEQEGALEELTL